MTEILTAIVLIPLSYFVGTRLVIPALTAIFGDPDE
jgi:hypothetical protein